MKLLLLSNSGEPLYEWCKEEIARFWNSNEELTFISAATVYSPIQYFEKAKDCLKEVGLNLRHLELNDNPKKLVEEAKGFLVGGGNTYHLLKKLQEEKLLNLLREKVLGGTPYIGLSAGANIAGKSILTTNDWNVIRSTVFDGLNVIPFNINPHYVDPHDKQNFSAESKDDRIFEYFEFNEEPVVALEEKTLLAIEDKTITVGGLGRVKLFRKNKTQDVYKKRDFFKL